MALSITNLKKGVMFQLDGEPFRVVEYNQKVMGRGGSIVNVRIRSLLDGKVLDQFDLVINDNFDAPAGAAPETSLTDESFVLDGEIDGRPEAVFKSLRSYAQSRAEVVIDCRRLRRMDFVCAGEMLNEVAALRGAGKVPVFRDLSYLVACLMMVMGIHDLAELNLRTH